MSQISPEASVLSSSIRSPEKAKSKFSLKTTKRQKTISVKKLKKDTAWSYLDEIFKNGTPQAYETEMTLQKINVYSLPETWWKPFEKLQPKEAALLDDWNYVVKTLDCEIGDGKIYDRLPTAAEERDEKANAKKPAKKKDQGPTEEELQFEQKMKEKEEVEKENEEIAATLSEEEKFYFLSELNYKGAWIEFINTETNQPIIGSVHKDGENLVKLENDVNNHGGVILQFGFLPRPIDESDKKKKTNTKGPRGVELKNINTVGWINLEELKSEGVKEIEVRCPLLLKETYEKRIELLKKLKGGEEFNPYLLKTKIKNIREAKNKPKEEENKEGEENKPKEETEQNKSKEEENKPKEESPQESEPEIPEDECEKDDYLEEAKTYLKLKIMLSQPINPLLPTGAEETLPNPMDLIKKEEKEEKKYTNEDRENDLIKQFKIAITAIVKVFNENVPKEPGEDLLRRERGNFLSNKKEADVIGKFLDAFNKSGRANLLKEKLKKFIVSIVRENFGKKNQQVKGVTKDKEDQFYSELYAYLMNQVARATDELVALKKDELHEDVIVTYGQSKKEINNYIKDQTNETEEERLKRLSNESELIGNYDKAVKYYKSILRYEGSKDSWIKYAMIAKQSNNKMELKSSLANAITIDRSNEDLELELIYCGYLYLHEKDVIQAINFLNLLLYRMFKGISKLKPTQNLFAFLSFLYGEKIGKNRTIPIPVKKEEPPQEEKETKNEKEKDKKDTKDKDKEQTETIPVSSSIMRRLSPDELLEKKFLESAKLSKINYLKENSPEELIPKVEAPPVEETNTKKGKANVNTKEVSQEPQEKDDYGNYNIHDNYKPPKLNSNQEDSIWFELIDLFNKYNFHEISKKLLELVKEETKEESKYKTLLAKTSFDEKNFETTIQMCDNLIKENPHSFEVYLLRADSYYFLEKYDEAEESYIRALRYKPQDISFETMIPSLTKLGLIFINEKRWDEAKVIFNQILNINKKHSFAWLYLGISLTELKEYQEAEKALLKANLLDIDNPIIWAYLTIYSLATDQINKAKECFNELIKVHFTDENLLKKIAEMFEEKEEYEFTLSIYQKLKMNYPGDYTNYIKLAELFYEHTELRKNESITILEEGLNSLTNEEGIKEVKKELSKYQKIFDLKITGRDVEELNLSQSNLEEEIKSGQKNINNQPEFGGEISVIKNDQEQDLELSKEGADLVQKQTEGEEI